MTATADAAVTDAPQLHYFCLASTDELNARFGVDLPTGAAANKVWGVTRALAIAGVHAVVVTGVIPVSPASLRSERLDIAGVPVVRVFATGSRLVRRLSAMFGFAAYTLRHVRPDDRVMFYNYFWDYLLAALLLRIAGRPAILDIEDGPRTDEPGLRGASVRMAYRIFRRLCDASVVTVSQSLAAELNLPRALPVYGAVSAQAVPPARPRLASQPINVLFGGTIVTDTGLDLFIDAIALLGDAPFAFRVTGLIDDEAADRLTGIGVSVHRDLSQQRYRDLMVTADIGISLKLTATGMGRTTFPSKVVEITSNGLLLITTRASDIPLLFDETNAILLCEDTPQALADALLAIAANLSKARAIAAAGQALAQAEFSQQAVGERLRDFIFGLA